MRPDTTVAWARFIIAAELENEDVNPFLELARRSGADMEAVLRLVDNVDRLVEKVIVEDGRPPAEEPLLSLDDFGDMRKFGTNH